MSEDKAPVTQEGNKIATSDLRPQVDKYLTGGMSPRNISRYLRAEHGKTFHEKTVKDYRDNYFRKEDGPIGAIVKVTENLVENDLPAKSDMEMFSRHFSFKSTNSDLELIYGRIRELKVRASAFPWDDTYDKRIATYLAQAEGIRSRVFRYQYEGIRKSILLNAGKKIVTAAISIFLPYVTPSRRKEAVTRFQSTVAPLLGMVVVPDEPEDIITIREEKAADAEK